MLPKVLEEIEGLRNLLAEARGELAGETVPLDRVETAGRICAKLREAVLEGVPRVHELRGIVLGLRSAEATLRSTKDGVRRKVEDGEVGVEYGKLLIASLDSLGKAFERTAIQREGEVRVALGRVEGQLAALASAAGEARAVLENHRRAVRVEEAEAEDGDWSGRGTPNGQRGGGKRGGKRRSAK